MSLKAKLEAVIYAAEEPVTLAQLAQLFAADALEWQAAQTAASQEMNAEMAGDPPDAALPLIGQDLEILPVADTAAMAAQAAEEEAVAALTSRISTDGDAEPAADLPLPEQTGEAPEQPPVEALDPEAEARRLARQRDREIKAILKQILDELIAVSEADDRGIEIREIAGGYRMATKPECHDAVRLFVKSLKPPMKLSLPALETLAVVAYKQPVTAPEVSEIRGVESGGVLGSLLARKLIATAGRKQVIGRPILYKTTKEFLLRFGLKDLTELPSMEEFEKMAAAEIEEMEPEAVAADAAQAAIEAAEAAEPLEESEALQEGDALDASEGASGAQEEKPARGEELAEAGSSEEATEATPENTTDATSAGIPSTSNEQGTADAGAAPEAAPETPAPAENEADSNAEEVHQED